MNKCSHKEHNMVDQSIQEEANEERDQACEEHHDHKESLSNKNPLKTSLERRQDNSD